MSEKWQHKQLGQLLKLRGGYAFKSEDFHEHGDVAVLRISNIKNNGIDLEDAVYVDRNVAEQAKDYKLREGNVVIAMSGATTGKTAIVRKEDLPLVLNQRVGVFDIYNSEHLSEEYLAYVVQSSSFKNQILVNAIGGAQPNISGKQIEDVEILLPPISEQRKIAAILSSVDEAIEKTEAIIEQTEKVKKGLMQQLLTKGIGHTKFKKTEIGEIPEEWEIVQLQNVTNQITDGTHKTPTYTENGIPFLRVTDIQSEEIDFTKIKYISEREHKELIKRCKPEKGDVLLSKNGTIGLVKVINWDWEFSIFVSLCLIKVQKDKLLPEFLAYFLQSDIALKQFRLRSKQGTVTNLHLIEIRELLCGLPSIEEQYKIVQILNSISKKISKETKKLEILMTIKKGLMQALLTGKVRVKVDDEVMSQ
ncbi:restriction endonuclease subunit S [Anoxybacillus kestanbolensis]|uniref:restriction endonuclease subunit S n=1 Tax=Anoxybacillus kestanbolensis TaxID=227476 RepID=UPI0018E91475|nr:restriction endonuclease subunit S [Anoxybacillus kestanbolensis]